MANSISLTIGGKRCGFLFVGEVTRGDARLFLATNAAAQIEAESGDGKILNQFASKDEAKEQVGRVKIKIGSGDGAEFKLKTAHGNVRIARNERG